MSYRPRLCEQCAQPFRPPHANSKYCSRECLSEHRLLAPRRTSPPYAYDGRLSSELQREVAAAAVLVAAVVLGIGAGVVR